MVTKLVVRVAMVTVCIHLRLKIRNVGVRQDSKALSTCEPKSVHAQSLHLQTLNRTPKKLVGVKPRSMANSQRKVD